MSFIPPSPLKTAVLFLIFNRPDTTAQVFEAIRKAKPPRLYIAADGPRPEKKGEIEKINKVREIATAVDWPCEVKTLFRDENLGCKYAVSGGITWFFENEEEGIILEDDCLPSQSFFWFCEILLNRYRKNKNIFMISGYNHFPDRISGDYYLCKIPGIWGWASWRNRWSEYEVDPPQYQTYRLDTPTQEMEIYWSEIFKSLFGNTWDYQLVYTLMSMSSFCIRSTTNLISNIGFGIDATHTTAEKKINHPDIKEIKKIESLEFSGYKNSFIECNYYFENRFIKNHKTITKIKNAIFSRKKFITYTNPLKWWKKNHRASR
jgi:hypothetical protein